MYRVTRIRLDDTTPAAARAAADRTDIVLDDREISAAGARALETVLNAIAPHARGTRAPDPHSPRRPRA
ncbi:hypothetical protein GCM10010329_17110 [Streptomyces spiroverticillatus]|uniref:Uncharacterized protein n=1 Tax=Streptomyces finlayi TaxID=67296 RepID=A0A918WTN6_9ACTN|nr:hypothetical protein GCM10010329_17110 [Streptomyces spiroverticillatus]GHC81853.1 hypothetical protein GCM10010334_09590 [Streptomyces finlayi]